MNFLIETCFNSLLYFIHLFIYFSFFCSSLHSYICSTILSFILLSIRPPSIYLLFHLFFDPFIHSTKHRFFLFLLSVHSFTRLIIYLSNFPLSIYLFIRPSCLPSQSIDPLIPSFIQGKFKAESCGLMVSTLARKATDPGSNPA